MDTGRLRASGKVKYTGFFTFRPKAVVSFDVEYAQMVHDGTRPHSFGPRTAKALRFVVGGQVVYARVVHHPGTRARPFLDRALREVVGGRGWDITNS